MPKTGPVLAPAPPPEWPVLLCGLPCSCVVCRAPVWSGVLLCGQPCSRVVCRAPVGSAVLLCGTGTAGPIKAARGPREHVGAQGLKGLPKGPPKEPTDGGKREAPGLSCIPQAPHESEGTNCKAIGF